MKSILTQLFLYSLLVSLCVPDAGAQTTPRFAFSPWSGSGGTSSAQFHTSHGKVLTVYTPSMLLGLPSGGITAVWLRVSPVGNSTTDTVLLNNVMLRLGRIPDTVFASSGYSYFFNDMVTVFSRSTHRFVGMKTVGKWVKFQLDAPYAFDRSGTLGVEISHGYEVSNNFGGFRWMASTPTSIYRTLMGGKDSSRVLSGAARIVLDIGFDMIPASVEGLTNLRSFGVFPNPSTDGRFMISLTAQRPLRAVSLTLMDATGKVMLRRSIGATGLEFNQELDASALPKGSYFVQLNADGEKLTRTVVLQ